MMVKS